MSTLWEYRARLDRVVDGDSVRLLVDLGMYVHSTQSIRLQGIDTPELFTGTDRERGAAARDFTAAWLYDHDHYGGLWPYLVRTEKDRQSFNRYVGTVGCWQGHDLASDLRGAGHVA